MLPFCCQKQIQNGEKRVFMRLSGLGDIIPTHRNPVNNYSKFFKYKIFTVTFNAYFTHFFSFSNFLASK